MKYEAQPLYRAVYTSMKHTSSNLLLFVLLIAFQFAIFRTVTNASTNTAKALVYSVCQQARQEVSGASEQACGDVQDRLNIEYLCRERNSSPNNQCWTEAK